MDLNRRELLAGVVASASIPGGIDDPSSGLIPASPAGKRLRLTKPQSKVFQCKSRFRVLVAGRRFGKTFLAGPELMQVALRKQEKSPVCWYVAPTYRQARQVFWKPLKEISRSNWCARPNETDMSVTVCGGGVISLRGADNYDSLRGPGLDFVVFDEFADADPDAWEAVLRPALSDREGGALFIGTPRGRNHFHAMYVAATEPVNRGLWSSFQFTTLQGGNVKLAEIEIARRDMDAKTFRQEYEASFENFEGRAYYAFDRAQNVRPLEYSRILPICWSLDFNVTPMSSIISQIEDVSTRSDTLVGKRFISVNILEEIHLLNSNTVEACQEFVNRTEKWQRFGRGPLTVQVYGDASGSARKTAAGAGAQSDWAIIREFFAPRRDYQLTYKYQSRNDSVRDRVAAVNTGFCNSYGERRCFVDPQCKHLIEDLEAVCWKPWTTILDSGKDKMQTHISDALGYQLWVEMGFRQIGGPRAVFVG